MTDALHTLNGKPIDPTATAAAPPAPTLDNPMVTSAGTNVGSVVHKETCGNVGATGAHGDLGTNAK